MDMDYHTGILKGEVRAASRAISLIENEGHGAEEILSALFPHTGKARLIGITGPPGSGKSTLTDKLAKAALAAGKKIGIIAVDPTSPFTGGAILGDRIRMSELATNPNVFIRSMGTRGQLGGLARHTMGAARVLDAFGCDVIFIETVGVGQSEIDIVRLADLVIMVAIPGMGDDIQTIKAGIMEIGHIFCVNKADRDGAIRTVTEIETMLDLAGAFDGPRPQVLKTVAQTGEGTVELYAAVSARLDEDENSGRLKERRIKNLKSELNTILLESFTKRLSGTAELIDNYAASIHEKSVDPYTAAKDILTKME